MAKPETIEAAKARLKLAEEKRAAEILLLQKPLELPSKDIKLNIPTVFPFPGASKSIVENPTRATIPLDTVGRPSAYGQFVYSGVPIFQEPISQDSQIKAKDLAFVDQVKRQIITPPTQRQGVAGVVASALPTVVAKSEEGSFSKPIVENPIPYTFRVLNAISSGLAAGAETGAELLAGTPDTPEAKANRFTGAPSEYASNLSRQLAQGEGFATVGEKIGKGIEDKVESVIGIRPEFKKEIPYFPDIGFDPSAIGYWAGFNVDIATPSLIEGAAALAKAPKFVKSLITKTPPLVPPTQMIDEALAKIDLSAETEEAQRLAANLKKQEIPLAEEAQTTKQIAEEAQTTKQIAEDLNKKHNQAILEQRDDDAKALKLQIDTLRTVPILKNGIAPALVEGGPLFSTSKLFDENSIPVKDYSGFVRKYHDIGNLIKAIEARGAILIEELKGSGIELSTASKELLKKTKSYLKEYQKLENDVNRLYRSKKGETERPEMFSLDDIIKIHERSKELDSLIRDINIPEPRAIELSSDESMSYLTKDIPTADLFHDRSQVYRVDKWPSEGKMTKTEWIKDGDEIMEVPHGTSVEADPFLNRVINKSMATVLDKENTAERTAEYTIEQVVANFKKESLNTQLISNELQALATETKNFYQNAFSNLISDSLSKGKKTPSPGLPPEVKLYGAYLDEWAHNISSIPERWKYWLRKTIKDETGVVRHSLSVQKAIDELNVKPEQIKDAVVESILDVLTPIEKSELFHTLVGKPIDAKSLGRSPISESIIEQNLFRRLRELSPTQTPWDEPGPTGYKDIKTAIINAIEGRYQIAPDIKIPKDVSHILDRLSGLTPGEISARTYFNLATEKASEHVIEQIKSVGFTELITPSELATINSASKELGSPLSHPMELNEFPNLQNILLDDIPESEAYRSLLMNIARIRQIPESKQLEFIEMLAQSNIGRSIFTKLKNKENILDMQAVLSRVSTPTARNRLASLLSRQPEFAAKVMEHPDNYKKSQYVIDNLWKIATGNKIEEANLASKLLHGISDWLGTYSNLAKGSVLGGGIIPVPAYHFMNIASAPLILYQNLGPSMVGAMTNLPEAARLIKRIYSSGVKPLEGGILIPGQKRLVDGVVKQVTEDIRYTYEELIRMFQAANLQSSQIKFEMTGDVIDDMQKYLGTKTKAGKLIPSSRTRRRANLKDLMNLNGPNISNEFAGAVDSTFRMSVMLESLKRGEGEAVAIHKARNALFDYGSLNPIERQTIAKSLWFYSFWRHNLTSTLNLMTKPQGWTRIKNLLMLAKDRPESEYEYSIDKPYLGETTNQKYDSFGPGIPIADAMDELATTVTNLIFLLHGDLRGTAISNTASFPLKKLASNRIVSNIFKSAGIDLGSSSFGKPVGPYPDAEQMSILEGLGLVSHDKAQVYETLTDFDLQWDEEKQKYKFGSSGGRAKYILYIDAFADLVVGRGGQELMKLFGQTGTDQDKTSYRHLTGLERTSGYIGSGKPYKKATIERNVSNYNRELTE